MLGEVREMIARTYDRRSGGSMGKKFDGAVSEPFSQESPQDVYNFTLSSSQGSTRWSSDPYAFHDSSDPYGFNNLSSQVSDELNILTSRGLRGNGDFGGFDGVLWKSSKKAKIGDSEPPCSVNLSPDSDELTILSSKNALENGDFGYPDGVLGRARDLEVLCLNSSQESDELAILKVKKSKENGKIDGVCRKSKKMKENGVLQKKNKKKVKSREVIVSSPVAIGPTATLMETQEFGEMMEHVDEVNFAMDGLKKGQPVRVRRGSLLSLLSICGTASQRRMLRAHGMAKTIIDAIMGLSFDDSPSNLAAAALFYVLTSDGNEDGLLDSPSCIRFLLKLLRPLSSDAAMIKEPTFGSKLLAICKERDSLQNAVKGSESCATIMLKVHEVLVSCKDLKPRDGFDGCTELPELNPKWISLLMMEKASFSTVSIEDTSGRVRRTGTKFKEKLRELGGLNAVFEVAMSCHSVMEGWLERNPSSVLDSNDKSILESLVLLLKCLKIMENATFLSNDNQSHLLGMKGNFDSQIAPRSFTKLILSIIKILSVISLVQNSLAGFEDGKIRINSNESALVGTSSLEGLSISRNGRWLTSGHPLSSKSNSVTLSTSLVDPWLKVRIDSSLSGSSGGKSGDFTSGTATSNGFKENISTSNNYNVLSSTRSDPMDDSQDPFGFDEDDFKPSKWDLLSRREVSSRTHNSIAKFGGNENDCQSLLLLDQEESERENVQPSEVPCSSAFDDEKSNLLADCLLSAVKVLMNLTNDNPMGCQQIAACGGLEALSSLIASHFPNFSSYFPPSHRQEENCVPPRSSMEVELLKDRHLTDQELDLLVAILGLLVNLIEKDGLNRKRLAAVRISLRNLDGIEEENSTDLIPLLCSIFLANQGAGEAAREGKYLSWDDEDALLQGEKEAEKMILEAYAALLLAFLSTESRSIRKAIADCLPDHNIAILVPVLERFVEFHFSLEMITPETHSAVLEVIESCRIP